VDLIVQQSRMKDGQRRVTAITQVMGMEGDTVVTQDLILLGKAENGDAALQKAF
jgi:pilus assembly protein CpaF